MGGTGGWAEIEEGDCPGTVFSILKVNMTNRGLVAMAYPRGLSLGVNGP